MMDINSNKGMYLEELVNRTSQYYDAYNLGLIEKRQIPTRVIKKLSLQTAIVKLLAKAKVDYFVYINNQYFEVECKQTSKTYFDLNLIMKHQHDYLKKLTFLNIASYILIYFSTYDKVYAISYSKLLKVIEQKKISKKINFISIKNNGIEIPIIYPGILDFKKMIK